MQNSSKGERPSPDAKTVMKKTQRALSFLLALVLVLSCVYAGEVEASAADELAGCTLYASHMSIRTTVATSIMTLPYTAAVNSSSAVSSAAASGSRLTATALYQNSAGEYWYQVGTNQYVCAADTQLVSHLTTDVKAANVVAPASLGYGKSFTIGGTVSATVNTLGTVKAAMYTGTDLSKSPAISASTVPTGSSVDLSTIAGSLSFSTLAIADYTFVLTAEAVGYYVKDGTLTKSAKTVVLKEKKCIINSTCNASGATAFGIDVSTWQGNIDWAKTSKVVDFAIFRSSYGTTTDNQFYNNLNGCVTYGVPFGIYVYTHALDAATARKEAQHALSLVQGYDLAFPIFIDMEESEQAALSNSKKLEITKAFCETIEAGGYEPGIYSALSWYNSYYTDPYYDTLFKWVAQIYSTSQYKGGTRMWQYSWTGSISGISGDVDCNYYYGEFPKASSGKVLKDLEPGNYYWKTENNAFVSKTTDGAAYNYATQGAGSISGTTHTGTQYTLERNVELNHDRPWVVEWKSSGMWTGGSMLLASSTSSYTANCPYLYRRANNSVIAFGQYSGSGSTFYNYGVDLSSHSIDSSATHVYRLENRINADGSNMVYLLVDGKELGPMNGYFIGGTSQNKTSNWISGKDFEFQYIGNATYPINGCALEYLKIWGRGEEWEPAAYRWEADAEGLTSLTGEFAENEAMLLSGSCTDGSFDDAYFRLEKDVVLKHDEPWSIKWQSEGSWLDTTNGALLLTASNLKNAEEAPYLYRRNDSELIALGCRSGGYHQNYGIRLADHGIDGTQPHEYMLLNRVNTDGTNMVYLYVDGQEIGPLNRYYLGGNDQGTTSDWVSGKDFTFSYMGCSQFPISSCTVDYMEIHESQLPTGVVEFRDWDGSLISSGEYTYGDDVQIPADPTREGNETYTYQFAGWDKEVVPCASDAVYTAVYTSQYRNYTVRFLDHDGTVLSLQTYHYGDAVIIPANPHRESDGAYTYTFIGWDRQVESCTGDAEYRAVYEAVAVRNPVITAKYPTLSFEGEIVINVYFAVEDMDDVPLSDMGLITWNAPNATGTVENAVNVIPGVTEAGGMLMARTKGIPAKNLGDAVYFKVYGKLPDGTYVYSNMYSYSAKKYATQQLSGSNQAIKPLIVAMLNYGAAAQSYFNYKPYNLVNKDLTAEQQALVAAYTPSMVAPVVALDSSKIGPLAATGGYDRIYPTVSFEGAFSIGYYFRPTNVPEGNLVMYYWTLADYQKLSVLSPSNATGSVVMVKDETTGEYVGQYSNIPAKGFDETVFVAGAYRSGGAVYCTGITRYSLGQYCKSQAAAGGSNQALAAATAVYGSYAKAYFNR